MNNKFIAIDGRRKNFKQPSKFQSQLHLVMTKFESFKKQMKV